jgi:hypothetical protein
MARKPVLLPPKGWRPPALTASVKVDVVCRQLALCACDGCLNATDRLPVRLRAARFIRFDHRPPVHEREWLPHLQDTLPAANDPAFIRALDVEHDKPITGADVTRMRKVGRIRDDEAAHAEYLAEKVPGQHRGRQTRNFGGKR